MSNFNSCAFFTKSFLFVAKPLLSRILPILDGNEPGGIVILIVVTVGLSTLGVSGTGSAKGASTAGSTFASFELEFEGSKSGK